MPLPSSGSISLNQIHVEAGGSSGTQCSLNDSDIRGLISKSSQAQMVMGIYPLQQLLLGQLLLLELELILPMMQYQLKVICVIIFNILVETITTIWQ